MTSPTAISFFVIDDDFQMIELLSALLKDRGHQVSAYTSSTVAMNEIESIRPDCLITDLVMGDMDGLELVRELRSKPIHRDMKIVMVTSKTKDLWRNKAYKVGVDNFITKPVDTNTFVSEIEAIFETS
ncbi:MAG: response regulator [Rhodospirillaceae bacterium]|jgi:CheY-like chemotaxis protein|nr:response regulator [Rhodospirillales bacterium]MBT3905301.1 response regulator [Rhodospirillaceae bacterium]MBT4701865.1 response regulator [Rhodospirillaceae bacterium]MBT5036582.1 response regulator [Rhodospirillaceae bacterium]MBT6219344.1 response regulator [Rhodospirillaceae bacterium]